MIKYSSIVIAIILVFATCKEEAMKETASGYKYEVIKKGSGEVMNQGEIAYFNALVVSLEGDVVFSTKDNGQPGIMKLESPEDAPQPNLFAEVLIGANVGDSIHIHLGKEESAGSGFDSLIYKVGVYESMNEEAYRAKMEVERAAKEAEMAVLKEQEPAIASKVAEIYSSIKSGSAEGIQSTESGLKYIIHEKGDGALIETGKEANVNYYGVLSRTGEEFDNSWKRGAPISFPLGQRRVIAGWDEGIALLPKGSKATLIIPGELGYGERGSGKIEANDELIFYIEVQK